MGRQRNGDKKPDYASLFTLRKDGRYMGYIKAEDGGRKPIYDRDPEKLYNKIEALKNPAPPSFREVAESWRDEHWEKIQNGTKASYNSAYKRAVGEHGDRLITELAASDINKMMLFLQSKDYSAKTAKVQRSVYKMIFDFAILQGHISVNPVTAISIPRGMKKTTREAPEDDIIEIIRKSAGKYFGLFPMFLLYTGFRRGEALAITWGDIDFKARAITCRQTAEWRIGKARAKAPKTDAAFRTVPLLDDLAKVLHKPKNAKGSDFVFPSEGGADFGRPGISATLATLVQRGGACNRHGRRAPEQAKA